MLSTARNCHWVIMGCLLSTTKRVVHVQRASHKRLEAVQISNLARQPARAAGSLCPGSTWFQSSDPLLKNKGMDMHAGCTDLTKVRADWSKDTQGRSAYKLLLCVRNIWLARAAGCAYNPDVVSSPT